MPWFFAAAAAMSVLSSTQQYKADASASKAAKKLKAYKNKMLAISNALNQNSITQNVTLTTQNAARQAVFQRRDELSTLGSVAVSAAAAGVKGRSVNATLMDVQRNAGFQENMRQNDLEAQFMQFDQERNNSNLQEVMSRDESYIPSPKLGTYMLSAGASVMSSYASSGAGAGAGAKK